MLPQSALFSSDHHRSHEGHSITRRFVQRYSYTTSDIGPCVHDLVGQSNDAGLVGQSALTSFSCRRSGVFAWWKHSTEELRGKRHDVHQCKINKGGILILISTASVDKRDYIFLMFQICIQLFFDRHITTLGLCLS